MNHKWRSVDKVVVGDRMRMSTEFIEQIKQDGDRRQIVVVTDIKEDDEGLKIIYLSNER